MAQHRSTSPDLSGLPLGRVLGVPLRLAHSWWLGAAVIVVLYTPFVGRVLPSASTVTAVVLAGAFALLLALSVLLHELGHCVTARRQGLPVLGIELFLLGGVSQIGASPPPLAGDTDENYRNERRRQALREAAVSVAGPAVSLLIGVIALGGWLILPQGGALWLLVAQIAVANLAVAVFNMLPGLPLDGGQLLRAGVWAATGRREWGTRAAAAGAVLVVLALLVWAVLGLVEQAPQRLLRLAVCLLLSWFVLAGAREELDRGARTLDLREAAQRVGLPGLLRPVRTRPATTPVSSALALSAHTEVLLGRPDGRLGVFDARAGRELASSHPDAAAGRCALLLRPEMIVLEHEIDDAPRVIDRIRETMAIAYVVMGEDGQPTGLLRRSDVLEALWHELPAGAEFEIRGDK